MERNRRRARKQLPPGLRRGSKAGLGSTLWPGEHTPVLPQQPLKVAPQSGRLWELAISLTVCVNLSLQSSTGSKMDMRLLEGPFHPHHTAGNAGLLNRAYFSASASRPGWETAGWAAPAGQALVPEVWSHGGHVNRRACAYDPAMGGGQCQQARAQELAGKPA